MKITEKWLKKHYACESGIEWFKNQKETDSLKILKRLVTSKNTDEKFYIRWFVFRLIEETDLYKILNIWGNNKGRKLDFEQIYESFDHILGGEQHNRYLKAWKSQYEIRERAKKEAQKTGKPYTEWAKKWGATYIKQGEIYARYFKADGGFGIMIKWHYDDSSDNYYVKWQAWIGNNKERPEMIKRYPVFNRENGIFLEAETDNDIFSDDQFTSYKMLDYIKTNNDRMIKLLKDNINKRLKKLQD